MLLLKDLGTNKQHNYARFGLYQCPSCGQPTKFMTSNVTSGKSTQCKPCGVISAHIKLSADYSTSSSLYSRWCSMKQRCYDNNCGDYVRYGAKGVTVCEDWLYDFKAFEAWALSNGYRQHLVIDKDILCDKLNIQPKIYSPLTCHWITKGENSSYKEIKNEKQ